MAKALRVSFAVVVLALASCAAPAPERPPEMTFAHLPPIELHVGSVEAVSVYQNSDNPPNVEGQLQTPPNEMMLRWARDRLRAIGGGGVARFSVLSAPITEEPLPTQQGFVGAFTVEPAYRYTITVDGQLEILGDAGQRLAVAAARVTQSGTLDEGVTPDERQAFLMSLTRSAMDSFNGQMERAIYQYLKEWTT